MRMFTCLIVSNRFPKWRISLNKYKIPAVAFWGSWLVPIIPRCDVELHTVIGAAIEFPSIANPTTEDVDKWHAIYVAKLTSLFDANKEKIGKASAKLDIW